MLEVQQKSQENFSVPKELEKKFAQAKNEGGDLIIFTPAEWKYFFDEVQKQIDEKNPLNFKRAANNARYLAMLDRGFKQMEKGGGHVVTDEELEEMIYGA